MICSFNNFSLEKDYFLFVPYLLGGYSPTIASFIVLKKNDKVKSFKEWIKNVFDFKHACELKVCTTKKPENPSVFLTLPVAHELSVLCMI